MNDADPTLAALTAYISSHPSTPTRTKSDVELDAEDYWADVGESMRDEAMLPMSRSDEDHRQRGYDEWLGRDAS